MTVLLYDGVCGLCSRLVQFVLARDRRDAFRFAPLQGDFARAVLARYGKDPDDLDTAYVLVDSGLPSERLLARGRAIVAVLVELGGPWRIAAILRFVPARLLDAGYDVIARHRYRWFGKYDTCMMPDARVAAKFIGMPDGGGSA